VHHGRRKKYFIQYENPTIREKEENYYYLALPLQSFTKNTQLSLLTLSQI
jgi:hypothetical protein